MDRPICTGCGKLMAKDGKVYGRLRHRCRPCGKLVTGPIVDQAHFERASQRRLELSRERYATDPEHRERRRASGRAWTARYPERKAASNARRIRVGGVYAGYV